MNSIRRMGIILSFLLMVAIGSVSAGMSLVIGGDNLGSHIAAQDLDMAGNSIVDIDSVTANAFIGSSSSSTYAADSDLLDGNDSLYYAIKSDVFSSTDTLQSNLDAEIASRISEDNLISDATGQIRIDFEAYDSTLDTSTTTLRSDLVSEIASRISEDNLLNDATNQLQTNITSEETSRISEDNLISDATGQIRTDFEAYDSTLNTSTTTLRTDIDAKVDTIDIDTVAELDAIASDYNILTSTEIDTFAELDAIVADKSLVNKEDANIFTNKLTVGGTFYSQSSYAHGYAVGVDVSVTGSTETFVILDVTWLSVVTANGFTISGASATYTGRGGEPKVFKVTGAFSASCDTIDTVVYWAIFLNGDLYTSSIINRKIAIIGDVGAMSISTLISLSAGEILDIRLSGNKSAVVTNEFVQFDIIQVN